MSKKVYELANEMGIGAIDLVEKLKSLGMNIRNHMVTLTDDELANAMSLLNPSSSDDKKDASDKKVVKRKVVKKVAKADGAVDESQRSDGATSPTEDKTKSTIVVKKKVSKKKSEHDDEHDAQDAQTGEYDIRTRDEDSHVAFESHDEDDSIPEPKVVEKKRTDVYGSRMHAFTPVFIPEDVKKKMEEEKATKELEKDASGEAKLRTFKPAKTAEDLLLDDDDLDGKKDSKKRMGDLAAMVSKKSVVSKVKDVTLLRSEEDLKFASNIVGRQIYTPVKKKKVFFGDAKKTAITEVKEAKRVIYMHGAITARELAQKLAQKFDAFKNMVLHANLLIKEEDYLGLELCQNIAALYQYRVEDKSFDEEEFIAKDDKEDKSAYPLRSPIITVMGHVDHGKTTLLDSIRKTKVTSGEAGGITQHIGAYSVNVDGSVITFLDTPGHAAFGAMRQRGANITDIVVLVVAADDGVMPQTKESIKYAQNANCPIIVAVNKMDKESANPDRVKQELTEFKLLPEDWGGDTMYVPISALKGDGIDSLLESIKIQAEMMDLRENPKGPAEGIIIESKIEAGRGPVATVLIQKGTLEKGDAIVCGESYGRARSLTDYTGKSIEKAGPSVPVQILGLDTVPSPGDTLNVVKNEREAKKIVDNRVSERKKLEVSVAPAVTSLEDFFASANTDVSNEKKILKLVIRADVQGSFEAIKQALLPLGNAEVGVEVIAGGVGAITDNDVMMAAGSHGFIIGFNMRPLNSSRKLAEQKGVEVRTYSVIYDLINDVTLALEGMLEPESVERYIGRAEVRDTFSIPKVGTIAGSSVIDGKIERGCNVRLLRDGKILYDGKLSTLKRFKDEVKEVANGYECGMALENFNDVKVNDIIEAYIKDIKKRKLEASVTL